MSDLDGTQTVLSIQLCPNMESQLGDAIDLPSNRPFDPWRVPLSEGLKQLVSQACKDVEAFEARHKLRKRRRKASDHETFEQTVSALMCDVIHHHLRGADGGVYISRSNSELGTKNRYRAPALNKKLPSILDALASPELAYLRQTKGDDYRGVTARRTVIDAGETTRQLVSESSICLNDIGESRYQDSIILKAEKESHQDKGEWLEYKDSDQTLRYRAQMKAVNASIADAELSIDRAKLTSALPNYDTRKRWLRRIFTRSSFESGGRLFGGFWQDMAKEHRRLGLSINGEPVAELDYGQVSPRILYGLAHAKPPTNDIYDILPLQRANREGIKKVFNSLLFREKPMDRLPPDTRRFFHRSLKAADIVEAIRQAHPAIAQYLNTEVGHQTQFIESQIMVSVLLELKARDVVALPIHDAVLVPASCAEQANAVMLSEFKRHTGIEGKVTREC